LEMSGGAPGAAPAGVAPLPPEPRPTIAQMIASTATTPNTVVIRHGVHVPTLRLEGGV